MHNLITSVTLPTLEEKKQAKLAYIKAQGAVDTASHSGIQVWSRFVPESTEDYTQLGYIHGSNRQPNVEANQPYYAAKIAYRAGYNRGLDNHCPFNDDGTLKE